MSCKLYTISVLFLFLHIPKGFCQFSDEINKMLGIESRDDVHGSSYKQIRKLYDSTKYFVSFFAESLVFENKKPEPNIKFLFDDLVVYTSYPQDDPKSKITILGVIDSISDSEHSYRRFRCKDKAGNYVTLSICYEFESKTDIFILVYSNTTYYYEIEHTGLPKYILKLLYSAENKNYYFANDISLSDEKEDAYNFLNPFGHPDKILKGIRENE